MSVRNSRKKANEEIKALQKGGVSEDEAKLAETKVQDHTNNFIKRIDEILVRKEQEIMTV